jgi:hypothetical protein
MTKNFLYKYKNILHYILINAYGINIFGKDSNSSATMRQGLTVSNEVILQAHAKKRRVCWLMHRHQHVGVNVRTPTADNLLSFQMWKNLNTWEWL